MDEGIVQPISVLIDQRGGIEAEQNWACNAVMCKVQWRMGTAATANAAAAAEDIKDREPAGGQPGLCSSNSFGSNSRHGDNFH